MEHVVFLDRAALRTEVRRPAFPHTWAEHRTTAPEELDERLAGATIVLTNRVVFSREVLARPSATGLRLIAVAATGYDCIDVVAARERGVTVTNVRGWCDQSVAEHVFAFVFALRRQLLVYHSAVTSGTWGASPSYSLLLDPLPLEVHRQTLGLVGYGSTGQAVGRVASALGMAVLVGERRGRPPRPGRVDLDEVLAHSDVVSLHCPLTDETRGLIGKRELDLMRPHALLINCARGGIVDEVALAAALRAGRIAGAGFDVLEEEPPRSGGPLLQPGVPNVMLTSHMAWCSHESQANLAEQLIATVEAFIGGQPRNVVGEGPDGAS